MSEVKKKPETNEKEEVNVNVVNEEANKRKQFGNRYLVDESKVFEHNAWDDVVWTEELEGEAQKKIDENSTVTLTDSEREVYELEAHKFWHSFYNQHQNKFFKDRNWLFTEFPELAFSNYSKDIVNVIKTEDPDIEKLSLEEYPGKLAKVRIFEIGCGVGNTVFPLLQTNKDPELFIYCCDIADSAIQIVKEHALYDSARCYGFTLNIADEEEPDLPFPPCSMDFVTLIFVLSAIHPDKMLMVIKRISKMLKPGGMLLFRDYGRHDMVQLRFKVGRCLSDNFYVRGDGTRVYFFTQDGVDEMFTKAGLVKKQNSIDRRLQINRGRQIKMYRIWIQCKYFKPLDEEK